MSKEVTGRFSDSASSLSPNAVEGRFVSLMYWWVIAVEDADEEFGMNIIGLGRFEELFFDEACCCCCCCRCSWEKSSCGFTLLKGDSCLMFLGGVSRDMFQGRNRK